MPFWYIVNSDDDVDRAEHSPTLNAEGAEDRGCVLTEVQQDHLQWSFKDVALDFAAPITVMTDCRQLSTLMF